MKRDQGKTKEQLLQEVSKLRRLLDDLEKRQVGYKGLEEDWRHLVRVQSLILNNSIMGIAFVSQRVFQWVNPRFADLLGLAPEQVRGASVRIMYASEKDYEDYGRQIYPALSKGEWFEFELAVHRSDGNTFSGRIIGKALNPSAVHEGSLWIMEDISERKRMEKSLRESEEMYRTVVEKANEGIAIIQDQRIVYVNPKITEDILRVSEEDLIGKPIGDFIHPDDREMVINRHNRRLAGDNIPDSYEFRIVGKNKEIIWLHVSAKRISWHGRPATLNMYLDVTERRQAEEELKDSQSRMAGIIENLPDATLVIDTGGKVIAWNRAIEQMTGIPAAAMLGKGDYEYAIPFYGARRPILIDLVLKPQKDFETQYVSTERQGIVLDGEAYMPALKGGEVFLSGRASVLQDSKGNIVGAIESIRDITERRKTEEKYRGIFDNAVMGLFHTTPDGRIINANPALARILGYESPEEVISTITDVSKKLYALPSKRADFLHLMNTQGMIRDYEIQLIRKDGNAVLVSVSGRAVRDGTGKLLYYEGTLQDITERRRLEFQLRQAQKMEAIGTLAGGIAHDFNNILASMIGFTEMAAKESRPDIRQKYLDRVLQACARAKNLTNQILSFSRKQEQEMRPLDVKLILKEALSLLRASLPATIEIKYFMSREQTNVLADPTQIHQVIVNLCTNAAQAMREKGGILDIRLETLEIVHPELAIHPDLPVGSYVVLSVGDTGHGIDPSVKDKIFDPFFTTKSAREGTGLGLSVVYGIVKRSGGAIDVQSTVGQGSVFTIYLPLVGQTSRFEETRREDVDLRGTEKILFVDDEESLVALAQAFFASQGYRITATASSVEALRQFREAPDRFDLVITDMTMPEMTGAELARAMLALRPDLPIILCTGYSDSASMAQVRRLNIREIVRKPVALDDLGRLVRRVLER